jgi:hypothetical protein
MAIYKNNIETDNTNSLTVTQYAVRPHWLAYVSTVTIWRIETRVLQTGGGESTPSIFDQEAKVLCCHTVTVSGFQSTNQT